MIQNLARMIFVTLPVIFLNSCGLPKVTLHQIDTVHNQANPFEITKYNKETCELELEEKESFQLVGPNSPLHGGVCLTATDYARLKTKVKSDCENAKVKNAHTN